MAKIYLLSGGDKSKGFLTDELKKLLSQDLGRKTNLVSIGAKREYEKNDIYFYGDEESLGLIETFKFSRIEKFDLIDGRMDKEIGLSLLQNADIICLQGGDPFIQLKYIKDNGYDKFLKSYKGIILGISAGSMNLAIKAFYSKDKDYPQTIFYDALGLVDITIDPHFEIDNESRVKEVIQCSLEHEIIGLPDYSGIIVNENGIVSYIGTNYIFNNGKQKVCNSFN